MTLAGEERIKMSYGRFIIIIMVIVITATVLMMIFPFLCAGDAKVWVRHVGERERMA